jgi:exoribonuclease-2
MVAELMILANWRWAELATRAGIPMVYRRQDAPSEPLPQLADFPDRYSHFFATRRLLPKGRLSSQPGPHAGLGLACYIQATSPLRRYQDLVCQRQLAALIQGETAPHDAEAVLLAAAAAHQAARELNLIERERIRHWVLRELEQRRGETFTARVIGELPAGRVQLMIEEFLLEQAVRLTPPPAIGSRLQVRLGRIDTFRRELQLRVVAGSVELEVETEHTIEIEHESETEHEFELDGGESATAVSGDVVERPPLDVLTARVDIQE